MKSKLLLTFLATLLFLSSNSNAQTPAYTWGFASDGGGGTLRHSAIDNNGNSFLFGIGGTSPFMLNGASYTGSANGKYFIIKSDANGTPLWIVQTGTVTGTSTSMEAYSISIDTDGNCYVGGSFRGTTFTFGNTTLSLSQAGNYDGFIAKFNSDGIFQWIQQFNSASPIPPPLVPAFEVRGLTCDQNNDIVAMAYITSPSVTIGSTTYITSSDLLVFKLNSSGGLLWSKHISGTGIQFPKAITTDSDNNVYLTGTFPSDVTFNPDTTINSATGLNVFLAKYDPSGNLLGAKNISIGALAPNFDSYGIACYENNKVVVSGKFTADSVDFGGGITVSGSPSSSNSFIAEFDAGGNAIWAQSFAFSKMDKVCYDNAGNIISGGSFQGVLNVAGNTYTNLTQFPNLYIVKFDLNRNVKWSDAMGSERDDYLIGINVRSDESVFIAGIFGGQTFNYATNSLLNAWTFGPTYQTFEISLQDDNEIKWIGNTSTNWFDASNWAPQTIPTEDDNILILGGRPNYPILTSNSDAKCKNLIIEPDINAILRMNAGKLSVYGEIGASHPDQFDFRGGGVHLFHGSNFLSDMRFNNLTITNENDNIADNTYTFNDATIFGNLKLFGTSTSDILPMVVLADQSTLTLVNDLVINKGVLGKPFLTFPINSNTEIPMIIFFGTDEQLIKVNNFESITGFPSLLTNVAILNPFVKFVTPTNRLVMYNLIQGFDFDLAGAELVTLGKIVNKDGSGNFYKITNSRPSKGILDIYNEEFFAYDSLPQYIYSPKIHYLGYGLGGVTANDTICLLDDFAAMMVSVRGFLDLSGRDLKIGSTTSNLGWLDVDSLGSSVASGTLFLLGNSTTSQYELVAKDLANIVVNSPTGVILNNATGFDPSSPSASLLKLYGRAKLISGDFNLNQSQIVLQPDYLFTDINLARIVETPGNTFINSSAFISTAYLQIDTNVTTAISTTDYGGLGLILECSSPLGQLSIHRFPAFTIGSTGAFSINRVYRVTNSNISTTQDAFVHIKYDESELTGALPESNLGIYRRSSDDAPGVWTYVGSFALPSENKVISFISVPELDYSTSPGGYTEYTLAYTSDPLRENYPIMQQSAASDTKILAYPNPFNSNLTVELNSEIAEQSSFQIMDLNGKLMHEKPVALSEGSNKFNLTFMEDLPAGIYFLRITSNQTNSIIKLVKN